MVGRDQRDPAKRLTRSSRRDFSAEARLHLGCPTKGERPRSGFWSYQPGREAPPILKFSRGLYCRVRTGPVPRVGVRPPGPVLGVPGRGAPHLSTKRMEHLRDDRPPTVRLGAGTAEDRLATVERWIAAQNPLLDHLADPAVSSRSRPATTPWCMPILRSGRRSVWLRTKKESNHDRTFTQ